MTRNNYDVAWHGKIWHGMVLARPGMARDTMTWHGLAWHVMLSYDMSCDVVTCHGIIWHVMTCHDMSWNVMTCHDLSCHVMIGHDMAAVKSTPSKRISLKEIFHFLVCVLCMWTHIKHIMNNSQCSLFKDLWFRLCVLRAQKCDYPAEPLVPSF